MANAPAALQSGAGTTYYLNGEDGQGLSYEKEVKANGITEYKHYLTAGGMVFALQVSRSGTLSAGNPAIGGNQASSLRYLHHDHLGSVAAITDGTTGQVIERLAFDPWGKRRNTNGQADTTDSLVGLTTDRGYTEHEHLDEMGLIHMNGRVYDPLVGRMMSADPFIQAPGSLQSYNRYAYVMNNPLNLTDPSGYFSLRGFLRKLDTFTRHPSTSNAYNVHRSMPGVVAVDNFVVKNPWAYALGRAAAGFWGGPWAAAGASAYYAYITTGSDSAAIKAFGLSIGTSYAFDMAGNAGTGADEYGVGHYTAHAAVGCASSVAGGGKCGAGALSAVAGLGATQFGGFAGGTTAGRFAYAAVAGGVASRLAGGSFIDGAQTAAYGFLFNFLAHSTAVLNPNDIGAEYAYGIDFESNAPRKELGLIGRGLRLIGVNIPGLGLLINGENYTQLAICAVSAECFGSRHLTDELRQTALGLEPQVRAAALTTATSNSINLKSMSRSNLETIVNGMGTVSGFNQVYGSTGDIMRNFKSRKSGQ